MPLNVAGDLSITAESNLGGLGTGKSDPIMFHWNPLWHVLPFLPALGFLALMALRFNRARGAWWALLPLALGVAARFICERLGSPPARLFDQMWFSGISGAWLLWLWLAAMLLLAPWLAAVSWRRGLLRVAWVTIATGAVALEGRRALDNSWPAFGRVLIEGGLYLAGVALIMLFVMGARFLCRNTAHSRRFAVSLLFLPMVLFAALLTCTGSFLPYWFPFPVNYFTYGPVGQALEQLPMSYSTIKLICYAIAGVAFGAAGFATILPFLVVAFASPFHRERVTKLLRLEPYRAPDSLPKRHRGLIFAGSAIVLCIAAALVVWATWLVPKFTAGTSRTPTRETISHNDGTEESIEY